MDISQMLPMLMSMMNGNKGNAGAAGNNTAGNASTMNYEEVINNMRKGGGSPMDMLSGMPGMGGMNPDMLRMLNLFSQINGSKEKGKGGIPQDMLFDMLGGSNPQFQQIKTMMNMFQQMQNPAAAAGGTSAPQPDTVNTASTQNHGPAPIQDLNPIKTIAPDAIHRSMRDYLKNKTQNGLN